MKAVLVVGTCVAAALGLGVAAPGRAAHHPYTVAFVADGFPSPRDEAVARGGRAAARALGIHFLLSSATDYDSLIALHVKAIVTEGYEPAMAPTLDRVRAAGILLLSSGDDIAAKRTLWVNQSDDVAYAHALADALATQIQRRGEYAIAIQPGQFPVANEWVRLVKAYVAKVYPAMKLDGIVHGSDSNGQPMPSWVETFMAAHPKLKGFVGITPRSADGVALAITQAHKVGTIFSAGNGGGDFTPPLPGWVRSGATELVFGSDPVRLGYLTVWAANYLVTGHRFKPGVYQVGGPIGLVRYYAKKQELRLGPPLTVTKTNVDRYANAF